MHDTIWREFHIGRRARDRYRFDAFLFATNGNAILANFHAARVLAQKINDLREQEESLAEAPERAVKAAQINALGLLDEVFHAILAQYRAQKEPRVMEKALDWLEERVGSEKVEGALRRFTEEFPPLAVYNGEVGVEDYLGGETEGVPHRALALEEMLMLWLTNFNPAAAPFKELFDDNDLREGTSYLSLVDQLNTFFQTQPRFGPDNLSLLDLLRAPILAAPHSLAAQLEWIQANWGTQLLSEYFYRLLSSLDFIKEEEKPIFFGPGPSNVPSYDAATMRTMGGGGSEQDYPEPERFSVDTDWMPRIVLLAKNAYVWLDQLSRQYGREMTHLDEIPDAELDLLARRGFTGLWFIGVWERSTASQRIKQMCGNPDAVASAYSLYDYDIAADLGGPEALARLKERAWARGIRLASDMVPNHMGIDSRWVVQHPDWFVSLDHSPFPAYSFNGANLSHDDRVGIFLEDHYYSRQDAAVVFKRVDFATGAEKYVYHGNDGTSMPWNDTAQLNYLIPEVREAVIQTILHVARQFPVIRFDAAMTLAKKHFQRLWFPEPGTGGAIPSRAEFGLTRAQFDEAIPEEFWREVVDRVAAEVPDTLLLAEAFWLMEGYFVRTLGMHRVYNSAFMNMMRDEENAKYRTVMKNTLEFDPDVMKRYVNFMNNPDERTAVDQFGKGDKYFGVCTLMATLPGLPMFGHAQMEGFEERYGMEYRRAKWHETPDAHLVERHEREISPLLHRRHIFSEVRDFLLYDFWTDGGTVNEDVFAYSNRSGEERALVVFHNTFADTSGWIRTSVGYVEKQDDGSRPLTQKSLGEGLGLGHGHYTLFRDNRTGLEYIRASSELVEQGLYVQLHAYDYHVFMDFREVQDNEWGHYAQLMRSLNGRGVPSLHYAMRGLELQPLHQAFGGLASAAIFARSLDAAVPFELFIAPVPTTIAAMPGTTTLPEPMLVGSLPQPDISAQPAIPVQPATPAQPDASATTPPSATPATAAVLPDANAQAALLDDVESRANAMLIVMQQFTGGEAASRQTEGNDNALESEPRRAAGQTGAAAGSVTGGQPNIIAREIRDRWDAALRLPMLYEGETGTYLRSVLHGQSNSKALWGTLACWLAAHDVGKIEGDDNYATRSVARMDDWQLGRLLDESLREWGLDEGAAGYAVGLARVLVAQSNWFVNTEAMAPALARMLEDDGVRWVLGVNQHEGALWFNGESLDQFLWWLFAIAAIQLSAGQARLERVLACRHAIRKVSNAAAKSGFQVEKLLEGLRKEE